jgi:hypothetical protein
MTILCARNPSLSNGGVSPWKGGVHPGASRSSPWPQQDHLPTRFGAEMFAQTPLQCCHSDSTAIPLRPEKTSWKSSPTRECASPAKLKTASDAMGHYRPQAQVVQDSRDRYVAHSSSCHAVLDIFWIDRYNAICLYSHHMSDKRRYAL